MPVPFPIAHWGGRSSLLDGLAAHYKLDEASGNRLDSLGVNPLTPTGSPANAAGKVGNAIAFDGTAKYAECADNAAFGFTTAMSVSLWLYPTTLTALMTPLTKWTYATDGEWAVDAPSGSRLRMGIAGSATDVYTIYGEVLTGLMVVNTWLHAVWLYDGTATGNANRLKLYANGVLQTLSFTGTIPSSLRNGTAPLRLGAWSGSLTRYWNGRIDEVGLWNRAITPTEIAALYNGGAGLTYPFS